MELGMIGLGKMGANMTERLVKGGHRVVGFDLDPESVQRVIDVRAEGARSLEELVRKLSSPWGSGSWCLPAGRSTPPSKRSCPT